MANTDTSYATPKHNRASEILEPKMRSEMGSGRLDCDDMLDELEEYYSMVLEGACLNTADPITANIKAFNQQNKIFVDGPKVGKTLVFMTRPNMNFRSIANIQKCRTFNYITSSDLGCMLARYLMYDEYAKYICYGDFVGGAEGSKERLNNLTFGNLGVIAGSVQDRYIGCCLNDPVTHRCSQLYGENVDKDTGKGLGTGLFQRYGRDCESPDFPWLYRPMHGNFIPMITNLCTETSAGKDLVLSVDETEGDFAGNRLQYGGGLDDTMGPGEITLTFDDLYGSPIMNMMMLWVYYIHYCTKGLCDPEAAYIIQRKLDYTCSIYVFMLDTDQQTIVRWIRYSGCFPKSVPFGQIMHSREIDFKQLSQVQIPFAYNFACPMDPISLSEFNMLIEPQLLKRYQATNIINERKPDEKARCLFDGNAETADRKTPLLVHNFINNHYMREDQARAYMLHFTPEAHESLSVSNDDYSKRAPAKLLGLHGDGPGGANGIMDLNPTAIYGHAGDNNKLDKLEDQLWTLYPRYKNRYAGLLKSNFGCIPYIVGGNKLMFL